MSDDLMKRLRSLHKQAMVEHSHFYVGSCAKDAMHRIEELEGKLAELLVVVKRAVRLSLDHSDFKLYAMEPLERAIAAAELKGQDDE